MEISKGRRGIKFWTMINDSRGNDLAEYTIQINELRMGLGHKFTPANLWLLAPHRPLLALVSVLDNFLEGLRT